MRFNGEVILVTGGSRGLGAAFARFLAANGARVALNSTAQSEAADQVLEQIHAAGGEAIHLPGQVEDSEALIEQTVSHYGSLSAVVHNAGFVRDKTLRKMTPEQWDAVQDVHLKASFSLLHHAWPHFETTGYGRVVLLSSSAGLYGNFGQSNYAAAKMGMYGLAQSVALEGSATNISCNVVAPFGATELNSGNMDEAFKALIKPAYIAPLVGYLCHPDCTENGSLFEASAGSFKQLRWSRSEGVRLQPEQMDDMSELAAQWSAMGDFATEDHPRDMREALRGLYESG